MKKQMYEFSTNGINHAIEDYVKANWSDLNFHGIDKRKLLGFESIQIFVQSEFKSKGEYRFHGDIRPIISDDAGGYTVNNKKIEGFALIEIEKEGLFVDSIPQHISIN